MALDDFVDQDKVGEDDEEETSHGTEHRLDAIANILKDRAIRSEDANFADRRIEVNVDELALWFGLMCLDVPDTELPDP